jgi:hypothetical protein
MSAGRTRVPVRESGTICFRARARVCVSSLMLSDVEHSSASSEWHPPTHSLPSPVHPLRLRRPRPLQCTFSLGLASTISVTRAHRLPATTPGPTSIIRPSTARTAVRLSLSLSCVYLFVGALLACLIPEQSWRVPYSFTLRTSTTLWRSSWGALSPLSLSSLSPHVPLCVPVICKGGICACP